MGKNKYYRQGGKLVGGAVSGGVGMLAYSFIKKKANTPAGRQFANKIFGDQGGEAIAYLNNPTVQGSIVAGAAYAGG